MIEVICISVVCIAILIGWQKNIYETVKQLQIERGQWHTERQQLLDRIQAPSFDHLKQAEVRVIRAQKEEKKEQPIELV